MSGTTPTVPSGVLRRNRSRIDYFLISDVIFENVVSCTIAQGFCKKSFDHKHIMLNFKKKKKKGRICINDRVLNNPLLDCAVKLAIYEAYLGEVATVPGGLIDLVVEEECLKLHNIDRFFILQEKNMYSKILRLIKRRAYALLQVARSGLSDTRKMPIKAAPIGE